MKIVNESQITKIEKTERVCFVNVLYVELVLSDPVSEAL